MQKVCELYYNASIKYGLNPIPSDYIAGFFIKLNKKTYVFRGCHVPFNDVSSASVAVNKYCTNRILNEAGLPVPNADAINAIESEETEEVLAKLRFPLVIKPTFDTSCGDGVTCNIKDRATLNSLLEKSFEKHEIMSLEEYHGGLRSYRVLILFHKIIGVVERIPAHVIGDGEHTISELIEIKNLERAKFKKDIPLGKIRIMPETQFIFNERGINADTIPAFDERIPIRYICNSTFGGSIVGLQVKNICKENADLLIRASKVLNLKLVGFDYICTDISIPHSTSTGFIIEANPSPDISIHETVLAGVPTKVSEAIIRKFIKEHFLAFIWHKLNTGIIAIWVRMGLVLLLGTLGFIYYVLR